MRDILSRPLLLFNLHFLKMYISGVGIQGQRGLKEKFIFQAPDRSPAVSIK